MWLHSSKGLNETGYVQGQNVTIEYHYLEGQWTIACPALMTDLVRRQVARRDRHAPATRRPAPSQQKLRQRRSQSSSVSGEDPVRLGLVASLARPGGNATGVNMISVRRSTAQAATAAA